MLHGADLLSLAPPASSGLSLLGLPWEGTLLPFDLSPL